MRVRCLYNTGDSLRQFECNFLEKEMMGRFGATGYSSYNQLKIGEEYLVMGVIIFETYQAYLVDDNGFISACPCQLFELADDKVSSKWHFRLVRNDEDIYPFIQAISGYYELCFDEKSYQKLIVDKDDDAARIYFRRKIELEKEIG